MTFDNPYFWDEIINGNDVHNLSQLKMNTKMCLYTPHYQTQAGAYLAQAQVNLCWRLLDVFELINCSTS